jgi:hypothetical protein
MPAVLNEMADRRSEAADFCNKIGTSRTSRDARLESGMRTTADIAWRQITVLFGLGNFKHFLSKNEASEPPLRGPLARRGTSARKPVAWILPSLAPVSNRPTADDGPASHANKFKALQVRAKARGG